MSTRALLIVTALIEVGTGLALLVVPSATAELLLGAGLSAPPAFVVARVAGAALIYIGVSCWFSRNGERQGQSCIIAGLLIYNLGVTIVLLHARLAMALEGIGLWPACLLHTILALWCIVCLRNLPKVIP